MVHMACQMMGWVELWHSPLSWYHSFSFRSMDIPWDIQGQVHGRKFTCLKISSFLCFQLSSYFCRLIKIWPTHCPCAADNFGGLRIKLVSTDKHIAVALPILLVEFYFFCKPDFCVCVCLHAVYIDLRQNELIFVWLGLTFCVAASAFDQHLHLHCFQHGHGFERLTVVLTVATWTYTSLCASRLSDSANTSFSWPIRYHFQWFSIYSHSCLNTTWSHLRLSMGTCRRKNVL